MRKLTCLLLAAITVAGVACGGGGKSVPASDVVSAIPWQSGDSLTYVLKQKNNGNVVGHELLMVQVNGASTNLVQAFANDAGTDNSGVTVDSQTLKPASASREIDNKQGKDTLQVTYSAAGALIKDGDKQSGLSVPDHAYDNDSSLFLWRTLAFAPGYQARYVTIITNHRSRQDVSLKVTGKESVTVAAGQFDAWRLEISSGDAHQVAWFADTPLKPMVKYDNDNGLIFELEKAPAP